jgi:4-aminobutyrate aminotransferase / (S)-3-amino-2-methylpropionate transaminase / 5-aminovalerate transaminase
MTVPNVRTSIPGPKSRAFLDMSVRYEPRSMSEQVPVVWDHADGSVITDVDGNTFIDFTSGVLVTNIGHSHPAHVKAVQEQAAQLMNCYDFVSPARALLAQKLVEITPPSLDRAFILSTGAEAVEAAIKMARRYTGRHEIIAFHGAFHGRTYGAMAAGGKSGVKAGFGPQLPGFLHASFPYCYRCPHGSTPERCKLHGTEALDRLLDTESVDDVAALITEPYQGGAGSIMPPQGWLKKVFDWCQSRGILFILDEVQSSFGRTGRMFAFEREGFVPNLITLGKGIGCGVPISAVVGESRILDALAPGSLGSTNGGNPLCCSAALAAIEVIQNENLPERADRLGIKIAERFRGRPSKARILGDVRGYGMVWGLEIVRSKLTKEPAADLTRQIVDAACKRGLMLIAPIGFHGNVIRLAPPLTIPEDLLMTGLDILDDVLLEVGG